MRAVMAPRWLFFFDWREYGKYLEEVSVHYVFCIGLTTYGITARATVSILS